VQVSLGAGARCGSCERGRDRRGWLSRAAAEAGCGRPLAVGARGRAGLRHPAGAVAPVGAAWRWPWCGGASGGGCAGLQAEGCGGAARGHLGGLIRRPPCNSPSSTSAPSWKGGDAARALRESVALAQEAERLGFRRFWLGRAPQHGPASPRPRRRS
jgi:hypothetical protein